MKFNTQISDIEKQRILEMHKKAKGVISEQASTAPFEIGKTYQMKRDKDNLTYNITIKSIGKNYYVADIMGEGTYEGQPLKRPGMELYLTQDGQGLQGNMEMGTFTKI